MRESWPRTPTEIPMLRTLSVKGSPKESWKAEEESPSTGE
jgi:hypothetical protein